MDPSVRRSGLNVSLVMLLLFIVLSLYVYFHPITNFDIQVTQNLQSQSWAKPLLITNQIFRVAYFRIIYVILIAAFIIVKRYSLSIFAIAAAFSELISSAIKEIVSRPRPVEQFANILDPTSGYSFISGHALEYTILFGFLGYLALINIKTGMTRYILAAAFFLLPILVGLGRVYTGAHWVTDIIGSYILGGAILVSMICYCRRSFEPKRRFK
jgi:undecaprenyl-diphosphatase